MTDLPTLLAYTALADQEAFAQLYQRTRARAWAICLRLLRDRQAAEDAMQDAYVKVWNQAATYRPQLGLAEAWLASIVRHTCLDHLRDSRRTASRRVELDDVAETAELADPRSPEVLMASRLGGREEECIDQLQERQRDLLTAAYVMGQSHAELARERQMPLGTVKTLIRRAIVAVRDCLRRLPA